MVYLEFGTASCSPASASSAVLRVFLVPRRRFAFCAMNFVIKRFAFCGFFAGHQHCAAATHKKCHFAARSLCNERFYLLQMDGILHAVWFRSRLCRLSDCHVIFNDNKNPVDRFEPNVISFDMVHFLGSSCHHSPRCHYVNQTSLV